MSRAPRVTIHSDGQAAPATERPASGDKSFADGSAMLTCDGGKRIKVREPGVLAEFDLVEALGDLAANQVYMQMVLPLIYLGEIDGDPVFPPQNLLQVKGLLTQLGKPGIAKLTQWYMETVVTPAIAKMQKAQKDADGHAALKN